MDYAIFNFEYDISRLNMAYVRTISEITERSMKILTVAAVK